MVQVKLLILKFSKLKKNSLEKPDKIQFLTF